MFCTLEYGVEHHLDQVSQAPPTKALASAMHGNQPRAAFALIAYRKTATPARPWRLASERACSGPLRAEQTLRPSLTVSLSTMDADAAPR
jgi:hypothetical protein